MTCSCNIIPSTTPYFPFFIIPFQQNHKWKDYKGSSTVACFPFIFLLKTIRRRGKYILYVGHKVLYC